MQKVRETLRAKGFAKAGEEEAMTTWTKLSERQPTEEDFKVGVVYGGETTGFPTSAGKSESMRWRQSPVSYDEPKNKQAWWTHWQRVSPPEQPRLRRWWLMNTNNVGLSLIIAFDKPMTGAAQVIEWPYEADPVPPKDKRERKR